MQWVFDQNIDSDWAELSELYRDRSAGDKKPASS